MSFCNFLFFQIISYYVDNFSCFPDESDIYHSMSTAPQVIPAPKPDMMILSPRFSMSFWIISSNSNGIDAVDVFPNRLIVIGNFSIGSFRRLAAASMIRSFA